MTDDFTTVMYQSRTLKMGAQLALDNRLYVPGWNLSRVLQHLKTVDNSVDRVTIGFLDGKAIAVAALEGNFVNAFCRKAYRNRGYGRRCVTALRASNLEAGTGIDGSDVFWRKLGVKINL